MNKSAMATKPKRSGVAASPAKTSTANMNGDEAQPVQERKLGALATNNNSPPAHNPM